MRPYIPVFVLLLLGALAAPPARARDAEVARQVEIIERFAKEPFEQKERGKAMRALGRMGGAEAAAALLPLFDDPFVHLRDHAVSAWIAMVKGDRAEETIAWFAKKGMKQRSVEVRAGIATALGFAETPAAAELIAARLVQEKDPTVLVALLGAVARRGVPEGDWKPEVLLTKRGGAVALATADALVRCEAADTVSADVIATCRSHADPLVRAAASLLSFPAAPVSKEHIEPRVVLAESLARQPASTPWEEIEPLLLSLLAEDAWRVRSAAIRAAVTLGRREALTHLVDRLGVEEGRLRLDLADALAALTGKSLGTDPELWRSYVAALEAGRSDAASASEGDTRAASFFRVPVYGTRIAFLLDCSGSMRDPLEEGAEGGPTKFALAREELERTLAGLDDGVAFDVFLYRYPSEFPPRPRMTRALGSLKPWSKARARKAVQWLGRQEAKGWGAFSDALALLLEEDVDTIFCLTHGRPSRGRYDRDFRLIAELKKANRFRQVVIHTVLTGHARADREFLEDLAEATGGRFSDAGKGSAR